MLGAVAAAHILLFALRLLLPYLAAAAEARIGGYQHEAIRTPHGVRLLIGDVRGKGLLAIPAAATLLSAFREAATTRPTCLTSRAAWRRA
ncbi:hypothetical protein ABZ871_39830 [Streptomyces populi]